jgi:hypothetical protein
MAKNSGCRAAPLKTSASGRFVVVKFIGHPPVAAAQRPFLDQVYQFFLPVGIVEHAVLVFAERLAAGDKEEQRLQRVQPCGSSHPIVAIVDEPAGELFLQVAIAYKLGKVELPWPGRRLDYASSGNDRGRAAYDCAAVVAPVVFAKSARQKVCKYDVHVAGLRGRDHLCKHPLQNKAVVQRHHALWLLWLLLKRLLSICYPRLLDPAVMPERRPDVYLAGWKNFCNLVDHRLGVKIRNWIDVDKAEIQARKKGKCGDKRLLGLQFWRVWQST